MTSKILSRLHPHTYSVADICITRLVYEHVTHVQDGDYGDGSDMTKRAKFLLSFWNVSGVDGGRITWLLCVSFTRPQRATCSVLRLVMLHWSMMMDHAFIGNLRNYLKGGWSNLFCRNQNKQWQNQQADCQTLSHGSTVTNDFTTSIQSRATEVQNNTYSHDDSDKPPRCAAAEKATKQVTEWANILGALEDVEN